MNTTMHYRQRCQQRGVKPETVQWLLTYGDEFHDHHGATLVVLTHKTRLLLKQEVGMKAVRKNHEQLRSYLVIASDGTLITVGKRHKRIKH